jgi:hypothetical protein
MDSVQDLIGVDSWRESLARSRARRGKPMPTDDDLTRWATRASPGRAPEPRRGRAPELRPGGWWRSPALMLAASAALLTVAMLAALLPGTSDGLTDRARARAAAGAAPPAVALASLAASARSAGFGSCQRVDRSKAYVNPLAGAALTPKRVDQGVDYTGTGVLTALGAGTVTAVATSDTGWPGAFIEYQLTDGPGAGCFVFYAEGIVPAANLQVGESVRPGQPIAALIPGDSSGIEIGWGAGKGTETYAAALGQWSAVADNDSISTEAGRSFNRLIRSLGGPPGRIER